MHTLLLLLLVLLLLLRWPGPAVQQRQHQLHHQLSLCLVHAAAACTFSRLRTAPLAVTEHQGWQPRDERTALLCGHTIHQQAVVEVPVAEE